MTGGIPKPYSFQIMLLTANFATWSARKDSIDKAVDSMIDQVDLVRVYYNDYDPKERRDIKQITGEDLTDRGKFSHIDVNEIAFTCDDDILYPPDYVERTLAKMQQYPNEVVTYHGRKLRAKGLNYYKGHQSFHCLHTVIKDEVIDVGGTGVMAFNTNVIQPDILSYPQDKMVDILMGLECAKKGVPIRVLAHRAKWLSILTNEGAIYDEMVRSCEEQGRLADQIIDLK